MGRQPIPASPPVAPNGSGHLRLSAAGTGTPETSALNFRANRTRANNAIVALGAARDLATRCEMPQTASSQVHLVVDVFGYFR